MNTLAELVGTPEEIEKGAAVRAQILPLIEKLQAPDGAIRIKEGDIRQKEFAKIRDCNNAKEWATYAPYLQRVITEDGELSMRAARYIAMMMQYAKNRNPTLWTPDAQKRYAEGIEQEHALSMKKAQFLDLPALTGTEKQIKWAITLREKARELAEALGEEETFETLAKSRDGKAAKFWIENRAESNLLDLYGWTIAHGDIKPFVYKYHWHDGQPWQKMTPEDRKVSEARRQHEKEILAASKRKQYASKYRRRY